MTMSNDQALSEVFCRVTEQLSFMFAEPVEPADLPPPGPCVTAEIGFTGDLSGSLQLIVPSAFCAELAINMLGLELADDLALSKGMDALKELLNVICGNALTELAGADPVFTLSIPTIAVLDGNGWPAAQARPGVLGFVIDDDHPALLQMEMRAAARQGAV